MGDVHHAADGDGSVERIFSTRWILRLFIGYLLATTAIIIVVDILNLFNSQTIMKSITGLFDIKRFEVPLFWYFISTQGSFTENVQWILLFVAVLCLFFTSKALKNAEEPRLAGAFRLWGIAMLLLFLEDTLNTRHWLRRFFGHILGWEDTLRSPPAIAVEVSTYAIMAFLMVLSLWCLRHLLLRHKEALFSILAGYGLYGVAAFFSATRHAADWYMRFGQYLIERLGFDAIDTWRIANETIEVRGKNLGYYFMDYLVEETLELLGAGLLAFGFVTLYKTLKKNRFRPPADEEKQSEESLAEKEETES